jgi:hypothetical protein
MVEEPIKARKPLWTQNDRRTKNRRVENPVRIAIDTTNTTSRCSCCATGFP